jgi:hypothetical protein
MAPQKPLSQKPLLPESEQSIKARRHELYEEEPPPAVAGPLTRKPFAAYLRDTPAAPLSPTVRALLWLVGVVVVALLVIAVLQTHFGGSKKSRPSKTSVAPPRQAGAPVGADGPGLRELSNLKFQI